MKQQWLREVSGVRGIDHFGVFPSFLFPLEVGNLEVGPPKFSYGVWGVL